MITVAVLLQLLIVVGALYDTARLLGPADPHRAPRALRRRAALEASERRLVERRLHGRIDAVAYREAMHALAEGQRVSVWRRATAWTHPHAEGWRALSRRHARTPIRRHPLA